MTDVMTRKRDARNKIIRRKRMIDARLKGTHTREEWLDLVEQFEGRCVLCGRGGWHLDKDHILPVYQGGSDSIENIQPLCARCNAGKGSDSFNWKLFRLKKGFSE